MKNRKIAGITLIALVITIIVLLILAGVSIATLTGENGILTKATSAKQQTEEAGAKEKIQLAIMSSFGSSGEFNSEKFKEEIKNLGGSITSSDEDTIVVEMGDYEATIDTKTGEILSFEATKGVKPQIEINLYQENGSALEEGVSYDKVVITIDIKNTSELGKIDAITVTDASGNSINKESTVIGTGMASYKVTGSGVYTVSVKATTDGVQKETIIKTSVKAAPEAWRTTNTADNEWYDYGNATISGPKLTGEMTPIKYIGETQTGNKWANAITADGSMWVWIPRYAYKITEGHHSSTAGKIEVAFVRANGNSDTFLNGETGEITRDPSVEGAGTTKWLVHPAFTANATNGGGFGEIEGLWVGKFEATGTETSLSVKPGVASLRSMTINSQYQLAKNSKFGETATIHSHMAKNSEWGATVYLGHSQYGTNGQKVEQNKNSSYYTGGSSTKATIYTTNKTQSTTHNATGVYDLNGGAWEYVASYVNNGSSYLKTNGGETAGDLYGATDEEKAISTAYKMVYEGVGSQSTDYETAKKYKGDAVYETSNSYSDSTGSWSGAFAYFPGTSNPFFNRGGGYNSSIAGTFYFDSSHGIAYSFTSFRPVLAF